MWDLFIAGHRLSSRDMGSVVVVLALSSCGAWAQ